jgi:predicted DNA-binding transcriptional regulator AlpA
MITAREQSQNKSADRALTRREAAEMTGYSVKTLGNLATLNAGPPFRKHRGHVMYLESELVAWLRSLPKGGGRHKTQG